MGQFIEKQFSFLLELLNDSLKLSEINADYQKIIMVGSGSSLNAAGVAQKYFEKCDVPIQCSNTDQYKAQFEKMPKHLLVAISQTGSSIATIDCIKLAKNKGYGTILVSASTNEAVYNLADNFIDLKCPEETIGPKTLGYSATILRLFQLAIEIEISSWTIDKKKAKEMKRQMCQSLERLPNMSDKTYHWVNDHENWSHLDYVTLASDYKQKANADEGALKLLETLRVPAISYEVGEFTHGPHRLIHEGSFHVFIASDETKELTQKIYEYTSLFTKNTLLIGETKGSITTGQSFNTIGTEFLIMIIFQIMANELALATGFNPDQKVHEDFFNYVGTKN